MFNKENMSSNIRHGLLSAVLFCIPMIFFITSDKYGGAWLLFLGNVLFLIGIAIYMLNFNKRRGENASTQDMIAAGHIATAVGILVSIVVAIIVLLIFVPDIFKSTQSDEVLSNAPATTGNGKTHGLVFMVFMNTIIGNLAAGSFASIILPISARKDQTKDTKSQVLNN